jgi:hypothetical protein
MRARRNATVTADPSTRRRCRAGRRHIGAKCPTRSVVQNEGLREPLPEGLAAIRRRIGRASPRRPLRSRFQGIMRTDSVRAPRNHPAVGNGLLRSASAEAVRPAAWDRYGEAETYVEARTVAGCGSGWASAVAMVIVPVVSTSAGVVGAVDRAMPALAVGVDEAIAAVCTGRTAPPAVDERFAPVLHAIVTG